MKHLLLLLSVILAGSISAQTLQQVNANITMPTNQAAMNGVFSLTETTACGPDTNGYALAKATGLEALNINNSTSAGAASQYFDVPQPLTLSGVSFYAWKPDLTAGSTMSATVQIFAAGLDSMPTGVALATTTTLVDTAFAPGTLDVLRKHATFPAPITVTSAYVVVVSNPTATPMSMVFNSWTASDGAQEWLASVDLLGTWTRSYDVNVGGPLLDADCLFEPHFTYNLSAGFTFNQTCILSGISSGFTNTSSPITTSRMYNVAAFQNIPEFSYTWDFGDGSPTENVINASHTYATAGSYTLVLTDTIYGWATNCVADTMATLTVTNPSVASFTEVTTGLTVDFTNTSTAPLGATFVWDFGDGNTSTQTDPTHTYALDGTYTVCLTVTDACGSIQTCSSVTVGCPAPTPAYTFVATGLNVDFTNTSTVGTGAMYLWDFGDGNLSTQTDPTHTYAMDGTYTVCLSVSDGCGSDSTCQTVIVSCPAPTPSYTHTTTGTTVNFTNTSTMGTGAMYLWIFGDGNTSSQSDPVHTYAADGAYTVCLVVSDACGADSTCQTIVVTTCVNPIAGFTSVESPAGSGVFDFTNTSTTTGTATYSWDFGDGNTSTLMNPSNTYASGGTYTVTLTITDSCGTNTFTSTESTVVGVEELSLVDVAVYPNPSNGIFTIEAAVDMKTAYVTDLTGKLIYTRGLSGNDAVIDATQFAIGTYFLSIRFSNDMIQTVRLEVVK